MSTLIVAATPMHRADIIAIAARRPWFSPAARDYSAALLGAQMCEALNQRIDALIDHPAVDFLVHVDSGDGRPRGWVIVQHEVEENVSGTTISMVRDPSWIDTPALLDEAARRAGARGSVRLGVDLSPSDDAQATVTRDAGLEPEYHRIVCNLLRAPTSAAGEITVRPAAEEDRLFLVALSTECVPFMFCASRRDEIERVRQRFFDVYALVDLEGDDDLSVWVATAGAEPAGAIQLRPRAGSAIDGGQEAYIFDISVMRAHWGSRVAVALVDHVIEALRQRGVRYLTGDISVDNERVEGLSRRFAFEREHTRWFRRLDGERQMPPREGAIQ